MPLTIEARDWGRSGKLEWVEEIPVKESARARAHLRRIRRKGSNDEEERRAVRDFGRKPTPVFHDIEDF